MHYKKLHVKERMNFWTSLTTKSTCTKIGIKQILVKPLYLLKTKTYKILMFSFIYLCICKRFRHVNILNCIFKVKESPVVTMSKLQSLWKLSRRPAWWASSADFRSSSQTPAGVPPREWGWRKPSVESRPHSVWTHHRPVSVGRQQVNECRCQGLVTVNIEAP